MSDSGHELRDNNEKIVKLMALLKKQRDEINYLIEKQEVEKGRIQNDIEKLTFKLTLLTKSLNQRVQARRNYDKTIHEIEENYTSLVVESGKLLFSINKEVEELEQIMDKKIGTPPSQTEKQPSSQTAQAPAASGAQARRSSGQSERSTASQKNRPSSQSDKSTPSQRDRTASQAERPGQVPVEKSPRSGSQVPEEETSAQTEKSPKSGGEVQGEKTPTQTIKAGQVQRPSILMDKNSPQDERPSLQTQRSERPSVQIREKKDRPSILLTLKQKENMSSVETEESEDEAPFKDLDGATKFSISKSADDDRRGSIGSKSAKSTNDDDRSVRSADEDRNKPSDNKKTARIAEKEATVKRPTETSEGFSFADDTEQTKGDLKSYNEVKTDSTRSLQQDCGRKNCSNKSLQSSETECSKRQCCSREKDVNKKHCHKGKIPEESSEFVEKRVSKHHSKTEDHGPWRSISDTEQTETYIDEKTPREHKKEHSKETKIKRVKSSSGASDSDDSDLNKKQTRRQSETSSAFADFNSIKEDIKHDEEVQSYREAYGRQHSQPNPMGNNGFHK